MLRPSILLREYIIHVIYSKRECGTSSTFSFYFLFPTFTCFCIELHIARHTKQVFTIAAISKGQQQASLQQRQFNELFTKSSGPKSQELDQQEKQLDEPFRPITFPTSDEDERPQQFTNANQILQSVDQKFPEPSPYAELSRPTRVAVPTATASTSNSVDISTRYTDDQLDYVRDFAWTMFQVCSSLSARELRD